MGVTKEKVKSFLFRYGIAFALGVISTAAITYCVVISPLRAIHSKDVERANKLQLDAEQYRKSNAELTKLLSDARAAAESATTGIDTAIGSIGDGQRGVEESQRRVRNLQDGSAGDLGLAQEISRQAEEAIRGLREVQKRLDGNSK